MVAFARYVLIFAAGALWGWLSMAIPAINDALDDPMTMPTPYPAATPIGRLPTVEPSPTAFAPVAVSPVAWHWYAPDGCNLALTLSPLCDRPTPNPDHLGR